MLHGKRSYLLQDEDGQVIEPHSISAGLDYPGHRPRACPGSRTSGRVEVAAITDDEALARLPALRAAGGHHAGAGARPRAGQVVKLAPTLARDQIIVMNLCGRGDKDMFTVAQAHWG